MRTSSEGILLKKRKRLLRPEGEKIKVVKATDTELIDTLITIINRYKEEKAKILKIITG